MTHQQLINQQQLKMNLKTPTVTIDVMKKTILVEIPGVTEDDLNVMSIDQIKAFYDELITGSGNQTNSTAQQQQACVNKVAEEKITLLSNDKPILKQTSPKLAVPTDYINPPRETYIKQKTPQKNSIMIQGVPYEKPQFLQQQSYQLTFNRYEILYGPKLTTLEAKRAAISKVYSPAVISTINALKPYEVDQTYSRLRRPEKKQHGFLKLSNPPQIQKFRIYVQGLPRDQQLEQLQKKHEKQSLKAHKEITLKPVENQLNDRAKSISVNKKSGQKNIIEEKNQKERTNPSGKKQKKQKSVQTDTSFGQKSQIEQNKDKRNSLRIISFTQYVQEDDMEPAVQMRPRPQNWISQFQAEPPHKIGGEEVKKLLMEPHQTPSQDILNWSKTMKYLVSQFEQQYLNQFKQDQKTLRN